MSLVLGVYGSFHDDKGLAQQLIFDIYCYCVATSTHNPVRDMEGKD